MFTLFYKQHSFLIQLGAAYLISPFQSQSSEMWSGLSETSKMESLTIVAKLSILDVCGGPATR